MSFSSRLKEKQEKEREQGIVRSGESSSQKPVNAFLERRQAQQREQDAQMAQAVQADHSMEKTDFFRADREQAARDYAKQNAKQRLSRFQPDFYGNLTPNTYLDSASSEELSALGKAERNRGKLADMAEEYAKARSARNTVSQNNLYESANSEQLSQMGKSVKEASNKREKEIHELAKYGFTLPSSAEPISYDEIEQMNDYKEVVEKAKEGKDPLARGGFGSFFADEDILKFTRGFSSDSSPLRRNALLSNQEKDRYYYLYEKKGKETADLYLESLQNTINYRGAAEEYAAYRNLPAAVRIPNDMIQSFEGGAKSAVEGLKTLPDVFMGKQRDYATKEHEYYQGMLLNDASGPESWAYKASNVIGNMAPSVAVAYATAGASLGAGAAENVAGLGGKIAGALGKGMTVAGAEMAAQTAGQTYREDIMEGRPVEGAQMNAALTAADEMVTNWLLGGIGHLGGGVAKKALGNSRIAQAAKQGISNALAKNPAVRRAVLGAAGYGADMLSEGTQEATQDLTESIRKHFIYGDDLDLVGDITDPQTWEDFALGAITAGVMNAPGTIGRNVAMNNYGKNLDIDYRDYAQGLDITPESYADPADYQEATELQKIAQEYATKQANKEFIPNRDKAEYDLRAQQFVENTVQHNEEKNVRETNQNDQQMEERQQAEQTYDEATKAEYEPYNEPETRQSYMPNTVEKEAEPAYTQGQPTPQTETNTNTETSPQDQTKAYRKPYGKNGQTALMEGYDGSIELSAYNKAFGRVYDAGYYNVDMNIAERSAILSVLGNDQFLAAYKAGAQDYNLESKAQRINMVQGAPKTGGLGTVAESAAVEQRKVAEHIGKMTGLKINLVDGMEQSGTVGSYKNGEITLSVNSNDFNGSLTHELTHHIKEYSPKGYRMYTEIAVEALMKSENISLENLVERYTNQYADAGQELTREEVMEEIVADATQKFFNDSEFIASVIKKDKTVAQRVMDFLSDVIDSIKQLMKNGSTRAAAKGLEEDLRYYEDARDAWMHALEDAGETYKSGMESRKKGQKERNALEKPDQVTEKNIKENYGKVREMESVTEMEGTEFGKGEKKLSEQILEFFESIGGKAHNEVVGDVILNKRAIKDDMANGISRKKAVAFAAIPDVIEKGYVLDHQKNWKGRGYDSAAIGAKVKLAGEEYYELVIVKLKNENHLYVHEVHTAKVGEDSVQDQLFPSAESSNGTSGGNPLPIYSIFDKLINVNGEAKDNQSENIRFQLEDVDDTVTDRRIEALLYENQTLRDANALLERQFELTPKSAVRQQDIEKVAKGLLKEYSSTYKPDTLTKNLDKLYEYIRSAEHVDGAAVTEAATSIAKSVLKQSSKIDTELMDQYKDLRKQIRNTKITISDQDKADLAATGGYNEFRKRNFGRMKLGSDGISIDSLYQELNVQYPELFPSSMTHPADQLMAIESALDMTGEQISNPYSANLDEMSYIVSQEIMQSYFDVRKEIPTFADKKAAEVDRVKREYSRKMADYKDKLKQEYKETKKTIYRENMKKIDEMKNTYNNLSQEKQREMKDYYMQKMNDLRNEKNWKLAAMQTKNREQVKKIYDSRRAREAKKSIMKEAKTLQGWLLKPTDAKHIPEGLRTTVAEFLGNIDFSANEENNSGIPTQRTQEWEKVKNEFDKIVKDGGMVEMDDGSYAYMEIDPDMIAKIEGIVKKVEGIDKLDNLDPYSLEEIKEVVVSMKKAITQINNLKSNKKYGQLSILADDMFSDLEKRRTKMEYTGVIGKPDKLLNYDMLDPQTMFEQIGPAAKTMYDALRTGLNQKTLKLKSAQDYIEKAMSEANITVKDIREWSGNGAKTERFKVAGGEIELTIADIMSLYELNKRPAARGHIYDRNGGIKPHQRKAGISLKNGKLTPSHVEKSVRAVRVTESDVKMITDTLTQEQKKLADAIQAFMGNEVAEWGNEVTMELYGYNKFTAGQYYPIVVDKSNVPTKEGEINQTGTIRNMGITKSTREHAHNPIIIEDIFDVYSRQVDQMSSYHAYVIPLLDLQRVYNYIDLRNGQGSIKEQIDRTFGKAGNDYIHKLLVDINGSVNAETGFINGMLSNMKAASVAGNLRVAIQQPTAYLRASMEISPKYLALGAKTMTRKGQWDLICKYAPIAQWKDWGFYRMDTSRQMKDIMFGTDSRKQRFVNKTMVLAEAGDKLAWNRLWRACEYECMDKHPELKQGSEEFYQQVGARFSEIVDKTQVVDSVLHRTQIMRSQDTGTKIATSFMAEPLKTYDMLYRAVMDVKNGKDKSKQRAVRAAAVFVATNVATALAAAVVDAARDDDRDKDYKEKYKEAAWNNFVDGMNIINNIPYAKDVVSAFSGYSATRADTAAYQDLYYAFKKLGKVYSGDSSLTPQYVALYTAEMSSKLLGIPIRSISRDVQAIADTAVHEFGSETADYKWLKQKYALGSKENLNLYVGMMVEAQRNGDKELQKRIKTDLSKAEIDNETITAKIKSLIKGELISKDHVDPRIEEAAQARMAADTESYKAAVGELIAEGYAGKLVNSAVDARINQLSGEEEIDWEEEAATDPDELYGEILTGEEEEEGWDIYSSGDILKAVDQVEGTMESTKTFKKIAAEIIDSKVKAGKTKKEALVSIKSPITRRYKQEWIAAYLAGDQKGYEAIQAKLNRLILEGKNLYTGEDYIKWRKEAKDKEKEEKKKHE